MEVDNESRFRFVSQEDNVADLISRIEESDAEEYSKLGHVFTEAAFVNRRFLLVEFQGKMRDGSVKAPVIQGAVRVFGFGADHANGSSVEVKDEATGSVLYVQYVPTKLFDYPVFVSIPVYHQLKWEAVELADGSYMRNLVFGLCFKQQSHPRFQNKGNVAVMTPNEFKLMFGVAPPPYISRPVRPLN